MRLQTKHIPNILTISRLILVPIIITLILLPAQDIKFLVYSFPFNDVPYYIYLKYLIAGVLFVGACLTDTLDGYLARRNKWVSNFGKLWDPIADKILINSILICFAFQETIPVWIPVVMITRDVVVDALRVQAVVHKQEISANIFGKLKTIFQMLAIIIIIFFFNRPLHESSIFNYYFPQNIVMYLALLTSIISGAIYFVKYTNKSKVHK